jgi:hypothetical protein
MKKIILFYMSVVMIFTALFISCSKENKPTIREQKNISKLLNFVSINDRLKEKENTNNRSFIIIVSWDEWGRKKKDCKGWGLCKAKWFPEFNTKMAIPDPGNGGASIVEYNAIAGKYFFDILLSSPPPPTLLPSDLTFEIDEDILLDYLPEAGTSMKILAGSYIFNGSIGSNGGYRIYLDTI